MKIVKILGITIGAFLLALLVFPYLFKDKIKNVVESEVSSMLNAKIYLEDFSLGFFSNFPNATATIDHFGIVGVEEFENDTLLQVDKLDVVINLASLFKDAYEINKIALVHPVAKALVNENGKANWDILLSDSTDVEEESSESSAINLNLSKFTVENLEASYDSKLDSVFAAVSGLNLNLTGDLVLDLQTLANIDELRLFLEKIVYEDRSSSSLSANLRNIDLDFKGKLSDSVSDLKLILGVDSTSVSKGAIPYLSNATIKADVGMKADLNTNTFTFEENSITLNEIVANFAGFVQLVDSSAVNMDLTLNTPAIDFKQILSLIPAIYANDFASIQTSGKVALDAKAKGMLVGDTLPTLGARLKIDQAMFKYPDLPSSVNNINIEAYVTNPGGATDLTEVYIPKFSFNMAGNPFAVTLGLKTPVSDPDFTVSANGTINLGSIPQVLHLNDLDLKGIVTAALKANGKMSYVDQERYELFTVNGNLDMRDFILKTKSLAYDVKVNDANLGFTSQNVNLSADLALGGSDIALNGKLQNFIQYVMRGETIKGSLDVKSKKIDTNELLGVEEENEDEDDTATTTTANNGSSVALPNNIEFALNLLVNELKYGAINLSDVKGNVSLKEAVAKINNLSAKSMGGLVTVVGEYNSKDTLHPKIDANMNVEKMSISEVFTTVRTAKKLAPMLRDAEGDFSMTMKLNSEMDETLSPVLNSINAKGTFKSKEVAVKNVKVINMIADKVNFPALKDPKIKDLNISFVIKDGRLYADPFQTAISAAMLNLSGSSGLDQTLDYKANITLPKNLSSAVNLAFDVLIGGTFKQPKLSFSAASMLEEVKEKVTEKIDEAKQKAIAAAKEQKEKLIAVAKGKKDELVVIAQKSGDKLIAEAQKQSDEMQAKAANPLGKAAAKKTGDALVAKAKSNAAKLVNEAETKGNALVTEAEKQGDNLIMKAETAGPDKK